MIRNCCPLNRAALAELGERVKVAWREVVGANPKQLSPTGTPDERETTMSHCMRNILLAAGSLILVAASAQPARAAQFGTPRPLNPSLRPARPDLYGAPVRPYPLPSTRPTVSPQYNGTRPIGGDWWRIYPWSPYNAWQNPYWYPPYNNNYPFPPDEAYPVDPYPVPSPWGGIGSNRR